MHAKSLEKLRAVSEQKVTSRITAIDHVPLSAEAKARWREVCAYLFCYLSEPQRRAHSWLLFLCSRVQLGRGWLRWVEHALKTKQLDDKQLFDEFSHNWTV